MSTRRTWRIWWVDTPLAHPSSCNYGLSFSTIHKYFVVKSRKPHKRSSLSHTSSLPLNIWQIKPRGCNSSKTRLPLYCKGPGTWRVQMMTRYEFTGCFVPRKATNHQQGHSSHFAHPALKNICHAVFYRNSLKSLHNFHQFQHRFPKTAVALVAAYICLFFGFRLFHLNPADKLSHRFTLYSRCGRTMATTIANPWTLTWSKQCTRNC